MTALTHPWTAAPAPGAVTLVAPGIKWLRMPLPFALDHINLWLLEDGDGWTVVDTGIGLPPTRERWEQLFATELEGRPITRVLVTHFHPDHMGNAQWLTDRWGVELWCTQGEWLTAQLAWRGRDSAFAERLIAHYRRHGCGDEAIEAFRSRGNQYPKVVPTVASEFRAIRADDVIAIGDRHWRVIVVLGHAPEHACLWSPEDGILISGDQVLPRITTNVSIWPDQPRANPLRLYLDSLGRFRPMPADTLVLPSHGLPFRGLHDRIEVLRTHHDARLAETMTALDRPRTGCELVPMLFRRALDIHQLGFAIGEVLAHLNLLESEGAIARSSEDGVERFERQPAS